MHPSDQDRGPKARACTMLNNHTHLVIALVHIEFIEVILPRLGLSRPEDHHVFAVRVLVVRDVGDAVQRVAGEHTLFLLVRDLDPVLGEGENPHVVRACYPGYTTLALHLWAHGEMRG